MATECIILAGGLGTRLRSVVDQLPKVMAPVNHFPFLHYLIEHLGTQGIHNIILATGYKHELIEEWVNTREGGFNFQFSREEEPLGTGGAIYKALQMAKSEDVLIINGDSFFNISFLNMLAFHRKHRSDFTIALKPMNKFDRYGCVETDAQGRITAFLEKEYREQGLINAGVYLMNRNAFLQISFPEKFSMEKDYMEKYVGKIAMFGFLSEGYFIDIGIPDDYEKAQHDFRLGFHQGHSNF